MIAESRAWQTFWWAAYGRVMYTERVKWNASLFVIAALLSGCGPEEPLQTVESDDPSPSVEDGMDELRKEFSTIAEPVELPEGTIDIDLVGAWLARYSVDQEKYDVRSKEYQVVVDVMVSDMNASQTTFELMADGTCTGSASMPDNPRNPGGSELAGNMLMKGVWNVNDGKLVIVVRQIAYSDLEEELPEPTPINEIMAEEALQTFVLSDDRKSFSQDPVGRDDPNYFPMVVAYHKEE